MNLQDLANIGELLGGLAILVSLIYLVLSIRQNTRQLRENLKSLQRTETRAAYEQHDRNVCAGHVLRFPLCSAVVRFTA
jgi:hypothetical protein